MTTRKAVTLIGGILKNIPAADSLDPGTTIVFDTTITPTISQADKTTNGGTGTALTIQAQNETGTTSTGGALILQSGSGTSSNGVISFKSASTTLSSLSLSGGYSILAADAGVSGWQFNASGTSQNIFIQAQTGFIVNVTTTFYVADSAGSVALQISPSASGTTSISALPTVTAFNISHTIRGGTGANNGAHLTIQAQSGQAQTGMADNNNGGNLILQSGAAGTGGGGELGGAPGSIIFKIGATTIGTLATTIFSFPGVFGFSVTGTFTISAGDGLEIGSSTTMLIGAENNIDIDSNDNINISSDNFYINTSGEIALSAGAASVVESTSTLQITGSNLQFFTTVGFGSGTGVISIANASVVPSTNPSGGGILYVEGGALKYRGSGGTITPIAGA